MERNQLAFQSSTSKMSTSEAQMMAARSPTRGSKSNLRTTGAKPAKKGAAEARPDRLAIAAALRETGLLLNISGGNPYKARAYLKAASALENLEEDFDELVARDRLTEIAGVGEALAAAIIALYESGKLDTLEKLKEQLPPGVISLSEVPGLTLRRIRALYDALQIRSVDELEKACLDHQVAKIKGFGATTEATILEKLLAYKSNSKKILLVEARPIAAQLLTFLRKASACKTIEVVGQVARWLEVVDTIEIVAKANANQAKLLRQAMQSFPATIEVFEDLSEDTPCRIKLTGGLNARLILVPDFATGCLEHSSSRLHFANLQDAAKSHGMKLDGRGLLKARKHLELKNEAEIYRACGLSFIPPEMREGEDEIELARSDDFSDLIEGADICGMTHCHTTYSDGTYSVEEMALAAEALGMQYLTITDHSPQASYAGGLSVDDLKRQWDEIDRVQERVKIRLLKGTECDILADGKLDYPDHILAKFDLIIASVHQRFKLDHKAMTARVMRAMRDRHFKVWGHPLGRLLLRRDPIDIDVEAVLDVVAEAKAAVEINGDPYRLDFEPRWIKEARKRGIKMIISTDAHSISNYQSLEYGLHMARRAGVRRDEVLNTLPVAAFKAAVKPGK
jgi:DNA polymerase (family X)